jgi:hypothetical protein
VLVIYFFTEGRRGTFLMGSEAAIAGDDMRRTGYECKKVRAGESRDGLLFGHVVSQAPHLRW